MPPSWSLPLSSFNSEYQEDGGMEYAERTYDHQLKISMVLIRDFFSVEIIFFSVIASKVKENANGARTFLEIVKARFGSAAHLMFLVSDCFYR